MIPRNVLFGCRQQRHSKRYHLGAETGRSTISQIVLRSGSQACQLKLGLSPIQKTSASHPFPDFSFVCRTAINNRLNHFADGSEAIRSNTEPWYLTPLPVTRGHVK